MTVSFASAWAFPDRPAPLAGVHIGTSPDNLDRFVPEQEFPLTYTIDTHPPKPGHYYYAPYQHHITIDGLEPDTAYYYVPVIGTREHYQSDPMSLATKPIRESMQVENVQVATKIDNNNEEQEDNTKEAEEHDRRMMVQDLLIEFDEHAAPVFNEHGRRLAPPPYNPSARECIDAHRPRHFKTAPASEQDENFYPMIFGLIGDIGQFEHSIETLEHMRSHMQGIQAVVLVGDIAYPGQDGRLWDTFFDFLDDHSCFDEIPLQIAAGNHDIDMQPGRNDIFLAYETRFRMPQVHPPELGLFEGNLEDRGVLDDGRLNMDAPPYPLPYEWGNSYYAFTYGPARHVVVNAYSDMSPGSTQYTWLEEELASVDRVRTPWVLLTIHVPLYNTFAVHHHDPQIFAAREHLEPLLVKYHVNVVFNGHIHAYQRTEYVAFNETTPTGPMHITIGAGGRNADAPFQNEEPEPWIAKRDESMYGYGRFKICNATHAEWKWVPLSPSDEHDFNVVKGHTDVHLPVLDHDRLTIENQYHVQLENERQRRRKRRLSKTGSS
ncbi:MAG: hypothetical protein SGILL_001517 [Bacillariaceae sp.]